MTPNSDIQKEMQKIIQGIQSAQNKLLPEELTAFNALVELYKNGNAGSGSGNYIQTLKNSHSKNL